MCAKTNHSVVLKLEAFKVVIQGMADQHLEEKKKKNEEER